MAKHLRIEGIVQGVGYRAAFAAQARGLHLSGWVRNRADGSVEAVVTGPDEATTQLIHWAHRGPPAAQVKHVLVTEVNDDEVKQGRLEILPTA